MQIIRKGYWLAWFLASVMGYGLGAVLAAAMGAALLGLALVFSSRTDQPLSPLISVLFVSKEVNSPK